MTDPTALGALQARRQQLVSFVHHHEHERDKYQQAADEYDAKVRKGLAEIDSIDFAIEVLEAAVEYAVNQASKEETDA